LPLANDSYYQAHSGLAPPSYRPCRAHTKLLLVTTGNITNKELLDLFDKYFDTSIKLFDGYDLIELNNEQIIGHER